MNEREIQLWESGINLLAGVDEAGRGPLAGPVFAAVVILKKGQFIEGVTDSKKLSEKKRELLYDKIIEEACSYSIAFADEKEVDELNIRNATFLAMRRAIDGLGITPEYAIIDGNASPGCTVAHECMIKGDLNCNCVGAASILAKVARDRFMLELDKIYPEYLFAQHKGYGTKLHTEKIIEFGPSPVHRMTFLKNILGGGK